MKVAFIIAILDSFGEREHAVSFARQLAAEGIATRFFVTAPLLPHLAARGVTAQAFASVDEALRLVDDFAPDWLIACEQFNLPRPLAEAVLRLGCRLATMDGTGLGPTINARPPAPPIVLPANMIQLRPCPVNAPLVPSPEPRTFAWPLFPGVARSDGSAARRRWRTATGTRLGMMALAPWAMAQAARLGRVEHYRELGAALADALVAARIPVDLVVVSPKEAPALRRERVTMRFAKYLPADVYDELLLGCDLVVSDNVIQTSLSKAFAARIPTLVVIDSRPDAPPWNMFPLRLLFPADAPYYRAVAPVELGDAAALRARVAQALAGELPDDGGYRQRLAALPSPGAILSSAMIGR